MGNNIHFVCKNIVNLLRGRKFRIVQKFDKMANEFLGLPLPAIFVTLMSVLSADHFIKIVDNIL